MEETKNPSDSSSDTGSATTLPNVREQPPSDNESSRQSLEKGISDTAAEVTADVRKAKNVQTWKWVLTLLTVYVTGALYGLDSTVVADVQGTVLERFGEPEKLAWIGVGFPLGSVAVILSFGKAYGIFDTKWLFFATAVLFEVGSAVCGAATNMNALIIGRVIAGAGGAGIYLGSLNILTSLTSDRERPLYLAGTGVSWGVGSILGPVIGGAFAESSATWRWAFYINLVIFALTCPINIFVIPSLDPQPAMSLFEKLAAMDWLGTILNAGIYAAWVLAITFGGAQWAWSDGRTIACFVSCGVLIILFILQQRFKLFTSETQRIFPAGFLLSRSLLLQYFSTACTATTIFIPVYYIPLFFQFTRNDGALSAAIRLLPFICVVIFCVMFNGMLMPKYGYYQPWYTVGGAMLLIGGALMFTVDANTSTARVYGYSVLIAIGTGLPNQASYSVTPVKVATDPRYGPQMVPDAIGFINMAQIGSIVHALAISGTVFQNLAFQNLKTALAGYGFTDIELHGAIAGTQSQLLAQASEIIRTLALDAIIKAMSRVYILVIVAGAVLLLSSIGMKTEKLFMEISAGGA
ncbi:MFS general substrate transporter [Trichoderma barbatum]